jgi:hypothetical protein
MTHQVLVSTVTRNVYRWGSSQPCYKGRWISTFSGLADHAGRVLGKGERNVYANHVFRRFA